MKHWGLLSKQHLSPVLSIILWHPQEMADRHSGKSAPHQSHPKFFFTRFTGLFIPSHPHAPNATSVYIFVQPTRLFLLKNHMPYLFRHVANTPCSLPLPLALPASDLVTPILAGGAEGNIRNVSVLASTLWHGSPYAERNHPVAPIAPESPVCPSTEPLLWHSLIKVLSWWHVCFTWSPLYCYSCPQQTGVKK